MICRGIDNNCRGICTFALANSRRSRLLRNVCAATRRELYILKCVAFTTKAVEGLEQQNRQKADTPLFFCSYNKQNKNYV